jgi:hypothetical protein
MKLVKTTLAFLIAFCLTAEPAFATAKSDYTMPQLRQYVGAVKDIQNRGGFTQEEANAQINFYIQEASKIQERTITVEELQNWNFFQGKIRVENFITIGSVIIGIAGFYFFFGGILVEILKQIGGLLLVIVENIRQLLLLVPIPVYELGFCGMGAYFMFGFNTLALQLVGAAIFLSSLGTLHGIKDWNHFGRVEKPEEFVAGASWIVYSFASVYTQSIALGVLASLAFVIFFGFRILSGPLWIALGFEEKNKLAPGTFAAGILTAFGVLIRFDFFPDYIDVLQTGALFSGTIVYFIGLVILSSKWVAKNGNYWPMQALTVVSGLAAVWLGAFIESGLLTGVGGTLFVFYLLQKYVEFCTLWVQDEITFGAACLLFSGFGFGITKLLEMYPQLFILNIF